MSPLGRRGTPDAELGPRSEEERERARLEREARRAAREGRAPDEAPAPPAPIAPVVPAPSPPAPEPPPREPPVAEPRADEPPTDTGVFPPAATDPAAHIPGEPAPTAEPLAAGEDHEDDHDEDDHHEDEPPIGTRSVRPGREATRALGATSRDSRRRRRAPGRRTVIVLFVLLIVCAIAWFANALFQPFHGAGHGRVAVVVPPNSSSKKIGDILEQDGVVSSGFFFALRARLSGKSSALRPGHYVMAKDMPYGDAITALNTAPKAAKVVNVTIPEGLSIREAGPRVKAAGLRGSYLHATANSPALTPHLYGAPKGTHSLEGFLFPSTYQLRADATVGALVRDQVASWKKAMKKVSLSYARSKHLTVYDVLTIASMVERESASPADRRKIAAVIYNRLHAHMPLGIDATLRFALRDWNKPLTVSQLHTDTPYNTRIHLGLPPTPIGNPGLAAIQAAAMPAKGGYLFYVASADGCGGTEFSATDAKFQQDVERYQAAVAANHGRVPTCKKG